MKYIAKKNSTYLLDSEEYIILKDSEYVTSKDDLGYLAEGLPTDSQVALQDELDSKVLDFVNSIQDTLLESGSIVEKKEINHNMQLCMEIYNSIQEHTNLHDFY